jgi:hypothetical protein
VKPLRAALIRLAYENPPLRAHLLPLLREEAPARRTRQAASKPEEVFQKASRDVHALNFDKAQTLLKTAKGSKDLEALYKNLTKLQGEVTARLLDVTKAISPITDHRRDT